MAVRDDWAPGEVLTSTDLNDTFAAKQDVSTAGLVYINTYSVTNQTTLTIDGIFTSAYPNYKIQIKVLPLTGNTDTRFVLRAGGSDTATAYWSVANGSDQTGVASNYGLPNSTYGLVGLTGLNNSDNRNYSVFDIIGPQLAAPTNLLGLANYQNQSDGRWVHRSWTSYQDANTQFDGIKFSQASGNITAVAKVWGYKG